MLEQLKKEEAVGFTFASLLATFGIVMILPGLAMLFLDGKEWAPVLLVVGSGLLTVAFHFTSAGNAAFSVAVPRDNAEMFDKAHEISYGAGIMATAGATLIALGIIANWIVQWTIWPYRLAFIGTTLLATLSFFQGLRHVRDQLPWAKRPPTRSRRASPPRWLSARLLKSVSRVAEACRNRTNPSTLPRRNNGFEDRGGHQTPFASVRGGGRQ